MEPMAKKVVSAWTKTLVSFPKGQSGFSLPELLVVVAIMAITASLIMPNLENFLSAYLRSTNQKEVFNAINGLGEISRSYGIRIDENNIGQKPMPPNLFPEGWTVSGDFLFLENGSCPGGKMEIHYERELVLSRELVPPFCEVAIVE